MGYTNKTDYTKQQLQNSLIETIEEKSFERITVKDIVDRIHVNRSTFYRYYDDKYQLIEDIEDKLIDINFGSQPDRISDIKQFDTIFTDNAINSALKSIQDNFKEYHALLGDNGDRYFETKLVKKFIERYNSLVSGTTDLRLELTRVAHISMVMGILKYWLKNSDRISLDEIDNVVKKLSKEGPMQYTKELNAQLTY